MKRRYCHKFIISKQPQKKKSKNLKKSLNTPSNSTNIINCQQLIICYSIEISDLKIKLFLIITLKKITKSTGTVLLKNSNVSMIKDYKTNLKTLTIYQKPKENQKPLKLKNILMTIK